LSRQVALRLTASWLSALALGALAAAPPAPALNVATIPTASTAWLDRLNQWRANAGVPALTENTTWSAGDYSHALYMVKNDLVTHYETPGTPYYTAAGDTAAQNSNIYVSSSTSTTDTDAIDWWMMAPFHELGLMDPRLTASGFGSYRESKSGWDMGAAVDVLRGNSFSGGSYPVYFPGNNTTEPLTTYGGFEFPDPLQACPGYSAPTGLPLSIQVGGNVATTVSLHSFTGNGAPLAHCVIDSNSPNVGSGLSSRGAVIVVPQQALQPGVKYTVALTVNGAPYTWSFSVGAFNACASVTASASPASLPAPGATVTVTGAAAACTAPQYEFWLQSPNGTWAMKQAFSPTTSWKWNTTGYPGGLYTVHVWGNQTGSDMSAWQALGEVKVAVGVPPPCATAGLSPASPNQPAGSTVAFTASSTVCTSPQYEYWVQMLDGSWVMKHAFSGSPTWGWDTTGLMPGTYTVHAWANQAGDQTANLEAVGSSTVTLTGCSSAGLSPATATKPLGSIVAFTASSSGCPNPVYEYWVQKPDGTWSMQRAFSSDPTWSWNTAGLATGTYTVHVWANQAGAYTGALEVVGSSTIALGVCSSATLSPATASQPAGSTVAFTASSSGCASPQYEYWAQYLDGNWYMKRAFSATATWGWDTTGLMPGVYTVHAWANQAGDQTANLEAVGSSTVTLTGCTSGSLSPSSGSAAVGTTVTLNATSSGCPNPQYEFWLEYPDGSWHMMQGFGVGASWHWNTTGFAKGTYTIHAWANEQGAYTGAFEVFGAGTYTLT
jgi:uncharacterized protein YkwD